MQELSTRFAQMLLNVKCIKVQPEAPFTWASGWLSPFYCDNRKTLAYPDVRTFVKEQLARIVSEKYPQATAIAGVATGQNGKFGDIFCFVEVCVIEIFARLVIGCVNFIPKLCASFGQFVKLFFERLNHVVFTLSFFACF